MNSALSPRKHPTTPSGRGPTGGDSDIFEYLADGIRAKGFIVLDEAFPEAQLNHFFRNFTSLDRDRFRRAAVGREQALQFNEFLRRDQIHWLHAADAELRDYFAWVEQLRLCMNRRLFLGLFDYECHYAYYPEGAFYKKHVDAFKGESNRRLSTILYLNPNWQPGDGGELALYHDDDKEPFLTVSPLFGRMVIFLSETFPHEVLRANRGRFSLTGWYRINGSAQGKVDPPLFNPGQVVTERTAPN